MQQLTIDSKKLNTALRKLAPVFGARSIMPLLDNVLFIGSKDSLTLTATDLKLTMIYKIIDVNPDPIRWLLPYRELLNITNVVAGPVTIQIDDNRKALLRCGKDVFKLGTTEDPSLFVKIPEFEPSNSIDVDGTFFWSLQQAAKSTISAEMDLIFCSILLDFSEGELRVVSSARSNLYAHKIKTNSKFKKQALFYLDFVKAVKDFQDAQLSISNKFICAKDDVLTVFATCNEQKFPAYEKMLPGDAVANCEISTHDIITAVDKLLVYNSQVPLAKLTFEPGAIQMESSDDGNNRMVDVVVPANHSVSAQTISINTKFFKDLLNQLPPQTELLKCIIPDNAKMIWVVPDKEDYDMTLTLGLLQTI